MGSFFTMEFRALKAKTRLRLSAGVGCSNVNRQRVAVGLASGSFVLAAVAFVPSAAGFTPAIGLSVMALLAAIGATLLGAWRTGALALVLVGATILVNPVFFPRDELIRVEYVFIGAPFAVVLLGAVLYLHYRKHAKHA